MPRKTSLFCEDNPIYHEKMILLDETHELEHEFDKGNDPEQTLRETIKRRTKINE
jgi:hypothetical protein